MESGSGTSGGALLRVRVDGAEHCVPAGTTLAALLAGMDGVGAVGDGAAFATAINGDFVAREARAARVLADGDEVVLVRPITGG